MTPASAPPRPRRPWAVGLALLGFLTAVVLVMGVVRLRQQAAELALLRHEQALADVERRSLLAELEMEHVLSRSEMASLRAANEAAQATRPETLFASLEVTLLTPTAASAAGGSAVVVWDRATRQGVLLVAAPSSTAVPAGPFSLWLGEQRVPEVEWSAAGDATAAEVRREFTLPPDFAAQADARWQVRTARGVAWLEGKP